MATTNSYVNYDDERFTDVKAKEQQKITESDTHYNNMINQSDNYYQSQIDATKDYAETQKQIQQEQTDFAIEQIEQQKEQAEKDYTKEQKGAYVDWQKQSNQYGATAEQFASNGLLNTGYSESSQVSMYNTYQNRVSTARESFNNAVLNYNNSIKEARLANNSALAEIAYNALQAQLELSLQGFQYKNTLLQAQLDAKRQIESDYYNRWENVLNQINLEKQTAMEEEQRAKEQARWEAEMAYQKERDKIADQQWQKEYNLAKKSSSSSRSYSSGGGSSSSASINKSPTKEKIYKANSTAKLSTTAAGKFVNDNITSIVIKNGGITESQLVSALNKGKKQDLLTNDDINKVLLTFGL